MKIFCWGMWGQQSAIKSLVTAVVSGSVCLSGLFTNKPTQRFHFGDCHWEEHAVGSSCLRGLWASDRGGTSPSFLLQQIQLEEAGSVKTGEGWFRVLRQIMARSKFSHSVTSAVEIRKPREMDLEGKSGSLLAGPFHKRAQKVHRFEKKRHAVQTMKKSISIK